METQWYRQQRAGQLDHLYNKYLGPNRSIINGIHDNVPSCGYGIQQRRNGLQDCTNNLQEQQDLADSCRERGRSRHRPVDNVNVPRQRSLSRSTSDQHLPSRTTWLLEPPKLPPKKILLQCCGASSLVSIDCSIDLDVQRLFADTFPHMLSIDEAAQMNIQLLEWSTGQYVTIDRCSNIPDKSILIMETNSRRTLMQMMEQVNLLKDDIQSLREKNQLLMRSSRDQLSSLSCKMRTILQSPLVQGDVLRLARADMNQLLQRYKADTATARLTLEDLYQEAEELRADVLERGCRVNAEDVEMMALHLSSVTTATAASTELFHAKIRDKLKQLLQREMEVVVADEKFLLKEDSLLAESTARSKQLTNLLLTLKRISLSPPAVVQRKLEVEEAVDTDHLLHCIRAVAVDDAEREAAVLEAEERFKRRKRLKTALESLRFRKSLQLVSKGLKRVALPTIDNQ